MQSRVIPVVQVSGDPADIEVAPAGNLACAVAGPHADNQDVSRFGPPFIRRPVELFKGSLDPVAVDPRPVAVEGGPTPGVAPEPCVVMGLGVGLIWTILIV